MHYPIKHILIGKDVKMIDFERCKKSENPKNVTQFCQFLLSKNMQNMLRDKGIIINRERLIKLLKNYKTDYSDKSFNELLDIIKG